jgi:phytoene dehydrogenase-like protein
VAHPARVIIIGAGHNGLICGAYLAQAGLQVTIVERNPHPGGACVTQELTPGHFFSTFAYSANGPGGRIFEDLDIPEDSVDVLPHDPTMFFPFPDGDAIMLWGDAERSAADLSRYSQQDADGLFAYQEFMQLAKEIAQSVFFRSPPTHEELYDQYRGTPHERVLDAMLTRSHWDLLSEFFVTDRVRCAFARADDVGYPTAVGSLLAEVIESANDGVGRSGRIGVPQGGMGSITAALTDAARRQGATIRCSAAVKQLQVSSHRATGVELIDGEILEADLIVSNADPKRTFLTLVPPGCLPETFRRQVEQLKTRAGNMKYHAVLNGVPAFSAMPQSMRNQPAAAASVRISPSLEYIEQAWRDSLSGIPSRQPVMSLQLPTAYTPDMAPAGHHIFGAWIRFAPGRPGEGDWDSWRPRVLESVHDVMELYAPGFRDLVQWERLYTPADIEQETGITDASIRHLDMTIDQMLNRRPLPDWSGYATPLAGLWMCGSGTHPCGSVTGAPGHNAARAILAELQEAE